MIVKQTVLGINTDTDHEYIDITDEVADFVVESGITTGTVSLFCQNTTSAIMVQENNHDMHEDTVEFLLEKLPLNKKYRHDEEGNLNATAHIKAQLIGSSVTIPITNGEIFLGSWQSILFLELYEARTRRVVITAMGN